MESNLKPEIKKIWDTISTPHILKDNTVRNEFIKRKLDIKSQELTIVFRKTGTYHIHGHFSTESNSAEIAIMKFLIKDDIVSNDENYL